MAEIEVKASQWRQVEVGRVVLFVTGPYTGKLAAIVEIIDHKRVCSLEGCQSFSPWVLTLLQVLVDGPSTKEKASVPRHASPLGNIILTPLVIPNLPRAAGTGALKKVWEKEQVEKKWEASAWAQNRERRQKRRALTDFERFKVMRLRKQVGTSQSDSWLSKAR